jgi:DMSO/TMAO reductase YedYZ molybdopterin-dependent catalytic subunit
MLERSHGPSHKAKVTRREFLGGAAGTIIYAPSGLESLFGLLQSPKRDPSRSTDALIPRQKNPDNLEFPFTSLDSFITSNEKFYVRNHFEQPKIDVHSWRLKIEGAVNRELELTLDDLRKLPTRTVTATLECAGNCRAFLEPKVKGVPWQLGAVGNAQWTGVPLAAVLERAGLEDSALEVILEGADAGEITSDIKPEGKIQFARSLPLAKARSPEVLLAYQMNGVDLPPAHGFPLRAIVPGWYGVASIKWLQRMIVSPRPFNGYFQSIDYSFFRKEKNGLARVVPITELQVKAQIARPASSETIKADSDYRIHGAAWTGGSEIAKVDVSTDAGKSWREAKLQGDNMQNAWRLWEYLWHTPGKEGKVRIMARATDSRGRVQPLERDPNRRNYMISHVLPVDLTVS